MINKITLTVPQVKRQNFLNIANCVILTELLEDLTAKNAEKNARNWSKT